MHKLFTNGNSRNPGRPPAVIGLAQGMPTLSHSLPFMSFVSFFRSALRPLSLVVALFSAALAHAQSPSAADGFDPNVDGNVYTVALQPDGKLIVAGEFTTLRPGSGPAAARNNIARLNADGSLDLSFDPNTGTTVAGGTGAIRALVLQPDGRILIGGEFTTVKPNGAAAVTTRNRVARLNADGTLDNTFNPNIAGGTLPQVNALALQPNGKIVVGGRFATVQPGTSTTPVTRNHVARFNADGTLDTAYNPNPNNLVLALASQLDASNFTGANRTPAGEGKIVIAGGFTSLQPGGSGTATVRNRVARLNADGTVDSEFDPNADNGVSALAVQRDGKIILGGFFSSLQPVGTAARTARNRIARLNPDGTLDSEFFPNFSGNVAAVAVSPEGSILVGGYFTSVWGRGTVTANRSYVAKLLPDGSLDTNFNAGANFAVAAFAFQSDGKIILGGYFTSVVTKGLSTGVSRNRVARVNSDGSLDATLVPDAGGRPLVSLVQPDGKILVGGSFTNIGGLTRSYLARLNADGSVDAAFNANLNGRVLALARQPDGKIVIGGAFTAVGSTTRNYLARLNADGSLDTSGTGYNPNPNAQVGVLVLQSDGKILVGGSFSAFTPNSATTATTRGYIARLNTDGSLDTFDPGANSTVSAIVPTSDGKFYVGGAFTAFLPNAGTSSTGRNYLARLNADSTVDTTFLPLLNARVTTLAVQSDGKIVVAGTFTLFQPAGDTSKTVTTNGVTSTVSTALTRNRLLRLNTDGTLDTAFDPNVQNGNVLALALQSDGKIVLGGTFTTLQPAGDANWTLRKYAARIGSDGKIDPTFNLDLNEISGNRVDSLALQSVTTGTTTEQKILIGGGFVSLQPTGSAARVAANHYARINANGTLDTAFAPGAGGFSGGAITGMALQNDGKIIAVGTFADIGGAHTTNVARFHPEGPADTSFSGSLDADGPVSAVLIRPDTAPVATQGNGLAWLNNDGTLRTAFAPSARLNGQITAVAVQADGRLLLGGSFSNAAGTTAGNLVRISADGTLDTSFSPAPDGVVAALAVQADGKILVGGSFTGITGVTRNYIARLNANGSLDTAFDPKADARVNAIVVQGDGKIVIGGVFTTLQPNGAAATTTRSYIARLNNDGTLDTAYNPTANALVSALVLQNDGKIVAGGNFTSFSPNGATTATARGYIARLNNDGTLDTFDPSASAAVNAIALYPSANGETKLVIGGTFTALTPNSTGSSTPRNYIARLNADGTVDSNFNPNPNNAVTTVAVQADASVVFGGSFTTVQANGAADATTRNRLARVNFAGELDTSFNPDVNNTVDVILTRTDGSLLVGGTLSTVRPNGVMLLGGNFATIGGLARRNLALINDDGTVAAAFAPNPNGAVTALLNQPDGSALVAGNFTTIAGATRNRLARFNNDGTIDTGYAPNLNAVVNALVRQSDGRILAGGAFTTVNGGARANLVRLLPDGSADAAFTPTLTGAVRALVLQGDGRILVLAAGSGVANVVSRLNADGSADTSFTPFNGGAAAINAIALQADGRVLVGGAFTGFVRRLNANGSVDTSFDPQPDGALTAITLQNDGRVLIGGAFGRVGGLIRGGLARLAATTPATQTITLNAARTAISYTRGGTGTEFASVAFDRSSDGVTWTSLGNGTRATGSTAWTITTTAQPASGNFYIRARAVVVSGGGTLSGLTETTRELNAANVLLSDAFVVGGGASLLPPPAVPGGQVPVIPPSVGGSTTARVVTDAASVNQLVAAALLATTPGSASAARLSNLSTRARLSADSPLLTGFAIAGTGDRTVLLRAVGPGLATFGVTGVLTAPRLALYDANGVLLFENAGWAGSSAVTQAGAVAGAFPLAVGSADSATVVTLAPGAYSIQVTGNTDGVALAEIYDVAGGSASRLVNVSSRGSVTTTETALISGFVIAGGASENVLVRGVGPGLAAFGVTGVLADPQVGLYDSTGRLVAANNDWSGTSLATTSTGVGAFALSAGSKDAALTTTLAPGAYTAQVTGTTVAAGAVLLEIYEVK